MATSFPKNVKRFFSNLLPPNKRSSYQHRSLSGDNLLNISPKTGRLKSRSLINLFGSTKYSDDDASSSEKDFRNSMSTLLEAAASDATPEEADRPLQVMIIYNGITVGERFN